MKKKQKIRIISKKYQTNEGKENKKEQCKIEEHNKSQEEREEVLVVRPLLEIPHISNE